MLQQVIDSGHRCSALPWQNETTVLNKINGCIYWGWALWNLIKSIYINVIVLDSSHCCTGWTEALMTPGGHIGVVYVEVYRGHQILFKNVSGRVVLWLILVYIWRRCQYRLCYLYCCYVAKFQLKLHHHIKPEYGFEAIPSNHSSKYRGRVGLNILLNCP